MIYIIKRNYDELREMLYAGSSDGSTHTDATPYFFLPTAFGYP